MAVTYPRALPEWLNFDLATHLALRRDQSRNARRNGTVQIIDRSDPRWVLSAVTVPLDPYESRQMDTWLDSLSGGLRDFIWIDLKRRLPQSYPNGIAGMMKHGGGTFDGTGAITAISATGLTISGLPTNFYLKNGDGVSIEKDGQYGLHTILEDATAVAGVVSVTVQPFIKTNIFTTSSIARLVDPRLRMQIEDRDPIDGAYRQTVRFSAIQRIV